MGGRVGVRAGAVLLKQTLALEQVIGGAAVAGGVVAVRLDPSDLGLEHLDPMRQLVERQWAKVLLDQFVERILRFRGKEIVEIHPPTR